MAPTQAREPFHRDGWVYEEKVDGWRMVAYKDGERVRLVSRNGRDHTRRFRDIAAAVSKLAARALVLDGEVAIYDDKLRSRFDWLREPDPTPETQPLSVLQVLHLDRDLGLLVEPALVDRPRASRGSRILDEEDLAAVLGVHLVLEVRVSKVHHVARAEDVLPEPAFALD